MGKFETRKNELLRKGEIGKVRWLENIEKAILPSQFKRIRQNDKTVLKELVLPSWVKWDTIYDFATTKKNNEGKTCILCNLEHENGVYFIEKYVCESCFLKIKNL